MSDFLKGYIAGFFTVPLGIAAIYAVMFLRYFGFFKRPHK